MHKLYRRICRIIFTLVVSGLSALPAGGAEQSPAALFEQHCATCHDRPETKAPARETLQQMPLSRILGAMRVGRMTVQAAALTGPQQEAVASYLATSGDQGAGWIEELACEHTAPASVRASAQDNWGYGHNNARHVPESAITPDNVQQLQLQWALAIPGATEMRSQPVASGGLLYLGTQNGRLLALDQASGCVHWQFRARSSIRTAIVLEETQAGRPTLFFADDLGSVYAVDAVAGELYWRREVSWFPTTINTGTPAYHDNRLLVPLSSYEVAVAGSPSHECCRSHGGVVALAADTGETLWEYHTTEPAEKTHLNRDGVQMWGPSGASVWTTPTIDAERGVAYIGTGENTSSPATGTSDAVIALDLATGEVRWLFQALAGDAWNSACLLGGASCPEENGPDFDFGGAIVLTRTPEGRDLVLAGQKSGEVFALDPARKGALVWRHRLSQGTTNGGIHWGMASDGRRVYVPLADPERDIPGYTPRPGVFALDVATGKLLWEHPVSRGCEVDPADTPLIGLAEMRRRGDGKPRSPWPDCSWFYGQSAAALLAGELVFAGALDGKLRILDADNGNLLRILETRQPYQGINGVAGHGGAIDLSGLRLSGRRLFVLSGYGVFGQVPGNVLLSYALPDKE